MKKRKVLILTDRFYPEDFFINSFIRDFSERGIIPDVLTQIPSYPFGKVKKFPGYRNWLFSETRYDNLRVFRVFTIQGYPKSKALKALHYFNFAILGSLVLLFTGRRYDRIFIFQTGPLTQALPAVFSKKLYGNKVFIWTLDVWPDAVFAIAFRKSWWLNRFLDGMVRTVYRNCDKIFVSSPGFARRIQEYAPGKEIHFMPQWSGAMETASDNIIQLEPGFLHFTFAGNIAKTQNLDTVILGFQKARLIVPDIRLNIFGDGLNLDELKQLVVTEKIEGVVFWGKKPSSAMASIFAQSHALIISLKPDPLFDQYIPLKFSSYIHARKPIFAVLNGEVQQLVESYSLGLSADPSDPDAVAEGFISFAGMPTAKLNMMSENSIHLSETTFNKKNIVDSFFSKFI